MKLHQPEFRNLKIFSFKLGKTKCCKNDKDMFKRLRKRVDGGPTLELNIMLVG